MKTVLSTGREDKARDGILESKDLGADQEACSPPAHGGWRAGQVPSYLCFLVCMEAGFLELL
jgi:hypothetical protein